MRFLKKILLLYKNMNIIIKASFWFVMVNVIDNGISVLTQPFVNRILTVEEVGTYSVFQSWSSVFSIIATFNLFCGVLEVYITKEKKNTNNIVLSLLSLSMLISSIFFGVIIIFNKTISNLLGLKPSYLVIMGGIVVSQAIIQFWSVPKRFAYSYKIYSILTISLFGTKSFLSVFMAYAVVRDRVLGRLIGLMIPSVTVAVVLLIDIIIHANLTGVTKYWKKAFLFNLPLIPHYMSSVLLSSSDRVMIERMRNAKEAGLYSVAYSYASLALIIFSAINSAYNPFALKAIKEKNYDKLARTTEVMLVFSMAFSIVFMFLAPEGMVLLGGGRYSEAVNIIPILIVGIFFSTFYFIFSNVEFVYEKNKVVFPITLCGSILNIVLNYMLLPKFGYSVAAYTTLIGYVFIATVHFWVSRRIVGEDIYNMKRFVKWILIFVIISGSMLNFYQLHYVYRYVLIIVWVGACLMFGVRNKDILKKS